MYKKIKKRSFCLFIIIGCILFENLFSPVYAAYKPPFEPECKSCYLFNVDTQTVVYEKNKDKKLEPASLVTIMTAIVVLEKVKDIDISNATAKGYIFDELYGKNGATAGIVRGETLTIRQLLECMLTQSACEAAMMLADAVCPDNIDAFVGLMNKKAKEIGANNTYFTNPHGLHDDKGYSTAYDMFLIAKYAMDLPAFMDIVSQSSHNISATNKRGDFSVYTTIDPIKKSSRYYYPPIRGIKTGTGESGRSFVSCASKDGFSYICCVLEAPYRDEKTDKVIEGNKSFEETIKLYRWAFENLKLKTIISADSPIAEVKLKYVARKDHLKVSTKENISALVLKDTDISSIKTVYNLPDKVFAPIRKGDVIGTAKLILDDHKIAEFNLVAFESADKNWFIYSLDIIKKILGFFISKVVLFIILLFLLIWIFLFVSKNKKKKRRRKRSKKNNIFNH